MFAFDPTDYPDLPTRGRSRVAHEPAPPAPTPIYGFGGGRRRASITAAANVDASGSVHTLAEAVAAKVSPKAGGLSQLFAHSEVSSRAPSRAPSAEPKKGRKKNKKKSANKATKDTKRVLDLGRFDAEFEVVKKGMLRPVDGGGNDWRKLAEPDWTFMKRAVSSTSSSRSSSPPRPSGLSSLLSQAHPGDLVSVAGDSDTSVSSENGDAGAQTPTETYEVALDGDYVNADESERRQMRADDFEPLRCLGKGT